MKKPYYVYSTKCQLDILTPGRLAASVEYDVNNEEHRR